MILTPYDTLACRAYQLASIKQAIGYARLENDLLYGPDLVSQVRSPVQYARLANMWFVKPTNEEIRPFTQPVHIPGDRGEPNMYLDGRTLLRANRQREWEIQDAKSFRFGVIRCRFNQIWLTQPRDLLAMGDLVPRVFTQWLTGAIVKRFGLDPGDQVRVLVCALVYWYSLFREDDESPFGEKEKQIMLRKLNQISSVPPQLASQLIDEVAVTPDLASFLVQVQTQVQSSRLDRLDSAFIFAALAGSWFGPNAKETIAVATEHVPTFIGIVVMALLESAYRRSQIGQLVYQADKQGRGNTVIQNARRLLGD